MVPSTLFTKYGSIALFIGSFVLVAFVVLVTRPNTLENCVRIYEGKEINFFSPLEDPYLAPTWFDEWAANYSTGPGFDRWQNYFYPYERHFGRWRNKEVVVLEIGVQSGGSTIMWPKFFGPGLKYYGLDIDPACLEFDRPDGNVHIIIADQSVPGQLEDAMKRIPTPDIIIDDGGHTMVQQNVSFRALFPYLKFGGMYLIEDMHTSYWPDKGGSSEPECEKRAGTMIGESKKWIDILNLQFFKDGPSEPDWQRLNREIGGVMFYDSMVFVEKTDVLPWTRVEGGDYKIPY